MVHIFGDLSQSETLSAMFGKNLNRLLRWDCLDGYITYQNQWTKWQWEVTDRICRLAFFFSICKKTKNNTFKFYSNGIGSVKWHFVKKSQFSSSSIPELSVLSAPQRRGVCCYSCSVSNIKLVLWLRFWLTLKFNYKWKG